ncbi:MAG: hypothetical protein COY74_02890 [Nitrosopumilales archaeon CG_4_10_14_0_8_um_filter_34_8]|nr:MAG: hypothetical protein COY74_02890 [Nitrosopumilales archaeon CG_4_10_14_0_8_um_filter_34_8]
MSMMLFSKFPLTYSMECTSDDIFTQIENTPVIIIGNLTSSQIIDGQEIATFQVLTNWKGENISKGNMIDIKLTNTSAESIKKVLYYLVFAEYDQSNKKYLVQSKCADSIMSINYDDNHLLGYVMDKGIPSQDPPEIMEVFIDNIKSLGYEIGDTIKISAKISNQVVPKEIKLVFKNSENYVIHEENITTASHGIATLEYVIPNNTKPGVYLMIGTTTNDVIWLQRGSSYIVNEPGVCPPGMYKHLGTCQDSKDFCKSTSGSKCTFDSYRGTCGCVSTGDCLIATASFGSELAPQVQMLREIRDDVVLKTYSGGLFMNGFDTVYYSFSPVIAEFENENPIFKEAVKLFITPMISVLSIMTLAEEGSEFQVITLGISTIGLVVGIYVITPIVVGFKVHRHLKSRK